MTTDRVVRVEASTYASGRVEVHLTDGMSGNFLSMTTGEARALLEALTKYLGKDTV